MKKRYTVLLLIGVCFFYQCEKPRCNDGRLNGDEEEIDCGGKCGPCFTCEDGFKNRDETGVDCGGVHCEPCSEEWIPITDELATGVSAISVLDENTIYAAAKNKIIRSLDGGTSWVAIGPNLPEDYRFLELKFFDGQNGYAIGGGFTITTHDGGSSWTIHQDKFDSTPVAAIAAPNRMYIHQWQGLEVSTDEGQSFLPVEFPNSNQRTLYDLGFFDHLNGWAIAGDINGPDHYVYLTEDGGQNWEFRTNAGDVNWWTFRMTCPEVALAELNISNTLHISRNYGSDWQPLELPEFWAFNVHFIDSDTAFIFTEHPIDDVYLTYRTTDGGQSWQAFGLYNDVLYDEHLYPRDIKKVTRYNNTVFAMGERIMKIVLE